ncbi:zinc finger MYM-type protein 1-like [Sipha flava]|uniref:Zinc finger MYM-type protein 1-like n=1 Tax=Sipha flava TaxID=143950 RepID=A0A8B8G691_9HEMI|nr:zinc finger MYM-type protein 1-like [Sipha flava]
MASKSASGAAKRKIKKQREESVKRMPKIDTYFKQNHEETEEQDIDNPVHFKEPLSYQEKRFIISQGPCQPNGPCIIKNNLNLSKLRGQGFDGAANMSGVYSVLNDAMNSSTEVKTFFGLVEKIYTFFSNSIKRWQLLLSSESSDISITLKRLCTTRWSSRSKNKDEIFEANYLKVHMEDFQFIFSVIFIGKILKTVNVVSKALQSPKQELSTAVSLLNSALIKLQEYRSQYSDFFEIAVKIAKKMGCTTKISRKKNLKNEQIYNSANKLVEYYDSDLSNALAGQILSFRSCFKEEITKRTSVKAITELLVIENPTLATTFSEICTACMLFLTLPVTVASAERSFSKLKLIKNYLRSTMCEERLSGLGILSIENDRARQLNLKEIINNFAEKKARKRNFH